MARIVNIHEAKTHFSKLLADIESGEEVIIARSGRQVAKLVPFTPERPRFADSPGELTEVDADVLLEAATESEMAVWSAAIEPR